MHTYSTSKQDKVFLSGVAENTKICDLYVLASISICPLAKKIRVIITILFHGKV